MEVVGKFYFLNDVKIVKGFNILKMMLLVGVIDQKVGGEYFSMLMKVVYLLIIDVVMDCMGSGQLLFV